MKALAVHVIVDLHGCPFELLDDVPKLQEALRKAAGIAKTTVLEEAFSKFQPQGVSGVLVVSESHLSVHTWPEHGFAAVDIFSCGDASAVNEAAQFLVGALNARHHTMTRVERGLPGQMPGPRPGNPEPSRAAAAV